MPKLKPEEVEHRRQEIINAARSCFLRNGFHQTTTDEICHEAAITPGGLYHYFDSKEDIISAVVMDTARTRVGRVTSMTNGAEDVRSAFREMIAYFSQVIRDPDLDTRTRLDIEIWAETLHNDKLAAITQEGLALRRQWLEALINRGREEGMYRPEVDPRGLANLLIVTIMAMRVGRLLWRDDFDIEGALESLVLMHAGGLSSGKAVGLAEEDVPAARGKRSG
jgi:TetR/AcrR family transcriptional repressor of uid operon